MYRSRGSSPRVRGTGASQHVDRRCLRFIPACAGNRSSQYVSMMSIAVHPRVCGEQAKSPAHYYQALGSSPRVRGTGDCGRGRGGRVRFIPACAGNSIGRDCHLGWSPVHPRVCGEQPRLALFGDASSGSSPRVRGTVEREVNRARSQRFIPACAGNSVVVGGQCDRGAVHPRVCGEQTFPCG